jgi:dihydrofolate synthase/folylpolyglutamate synthase
MDATSKLLKELYSLHHNNMTHDTTRISKLSNFLNNPHKKYPVVHIAGTNGKGSVCCLLASILQENGLKVGLYTSPHIIEFNERIRINGIKISDNDIEKHYNIINRLATELKASFFEITTAIAFNYFAENKIDIAIIETGLGGRLDSTNIVEPMLSVITDIGIDHTEQLGKTTQSVAKEKAGIIKASTPVVIQETDSQILKIFQQKAKDLDAPIFLSFDIPRIEFMGINNKFRMRLNLD